MNSWLDASLELDYAVIVADLVIDREVRISKMEEAWLSQFVKNSIIEFTAISAVLEFWRIPFDKIPYMDEIKVRLLELKSNLLSAIKKPSAKDFSGIWTKEDAALIEKALREGAGQIDEDGWA